MERYLAWFGVGQIDLLLCDREFVGAAWLEFLCKNNIPFAIRLREGQRVWLSDGRVLSFEQLLRKRRNGTRQGRFRDMTTPLRFAARTLADERLVIATNIQDAARALRLCKKRWAIECAFGDAKSRGLNIEDTHITAPDKLDTLFGIVALALSWAQLTACKILSRSPIQRCAHGRPAKSIFRIGLDALRRWLIHDPEKATQIWLRVTPRALSI